MRYDQKVGGMSNLKFLKVNKVKDTLLLAPLKILPLISNTSPFFLLSEAVLEVPFNECLFEATPMFLICLKHLQQFLSNNNVVVHPHPSYSTDLVQ